MELQKKDLNDKPVSATEVTAASYKLTDFGEAPEGPIDVKKVETVTLTGTSGTASISVGNIPGIAEWTGDIYETVTITINSPAVTTGTIAVKLDDTLTVSGIVTTDGDTEIDVAAAIYAEAASFTGWTLTDPDGTAVVVFTCDTLGAQAGTPSLTATTTTFETEATINTVIGGEGSLSLTAAQFKDDYEEAYLAGGIVLDNSTDTLVFTAEVAGEDFADASISGLTGDLGATSEVTIANVSVSIPGDLIVFRYDADYEYMWNPLTKAWKRSSFSTWGES